MTFRQCLYPYCGVIHHRHTISIGNKNPCKHKVIMPTMEYFYHSKIEKQVANMIIIPTNTPSKTVFFSCNDINRSTVLNL